MKPRVHNLEAELLKKESRGPLGSKWCASRSLLARNRRSCSLESPHRRARKLVVVDGTKRTIRYHKPNEDKRKTPRKIFRRARGVPRVTLERNGRVCPGS